jgi:hypothetical protein
LLLMFFYLAYAKAYALIKGMSKTYLRGGAASLHTASIYRKV